MVTFCVCVCVLAGVIFNWLRSAGVRNSYTLQPLGGPSVRSWPLYESCLKTPEVCSVRTGPRPTGRRCASVHISLVPVCALLYSLTLPSALFSPFVFIRAMSRVCFFPAVVFGRRSLLRISKRLLWALGAGGARFHNMMDGPFIKLVTVYQLVLWKMGHCCVTGSAALKQVDFHHRVIKWKGWWF